MAEKNSEKANAAGGLGEEEADTEESVVNSDDIKDSAPRLEQKKEKALGESPAPPRLEEQDARDKRAAGEVEGLKKNIQEKEGVIRDYENLLKKIQAEFDNYRKRIEREREDYSKYVVEKLVRKLVTIVDDLDRGLSESNGNGGHDAFRAGIEKIRNNITQILAEEGLKEIQTGGKFDPYYHEAIVVEENPDYEDNQITEVYQKGFTLGGKVLRPAKVRVSRNPPKKDENDKERNEI